MKNKTITSEQVIKEIKSLLNYRSDNQKEILTLKEAAEFTGLTRNYIWKLCSEKQIPFYKPRNKMNYFKKSELINWMLQNKQGIERKNND